MFHFLLGDYLHLYDEDEQISERIKEKYGNRVHTKEELRKIIMEILNSKD